MDNIDDDIDDFVQDDEEGITESGYAIGDYYGLDPMPEIDDVVDSSDERAAADTYDKYVGAEVSLPDPKGMSLMAKVMKKVSSADNNESKNYNMLQDHSHYEVQFSDGTTEELTANVIAENMLSDVDSEGYHYQLLSEIVDHKKDGSAILKSNGFIRSDTSRWSDRC